MEATAIKGYTVVLPSFFVRYRIEIPRSLANSFFLPQVWLIASSLADILIAVAMVLLVSDQID